MTRALFVCLAVAAGTLSMPCFAEAGVPPMRCASTSCSCWGVVCQCGQVCVAWGTCSAQPAYCQRNEDCALPCGDFVCQFNVCTRGPDAGACTLDGGLPTLDAGFTAAGQPALRQGSCDVVLPAAKPTVPNAGCALAGGGLGVAVLALRKMRRRMTR